MAEVKIPESMEIQKQIMDKQAELAELMHKKALADAREYKHWVELQVKAAQQQQGRSGLAIPGGGMN